MRALSIFDGGCLRLLRPLAASVIVLVANFAPAGEENPPSSKESSDHAADHSNGSGNNAPQAAAPISLKFAGKVAEYHDEKVDSFLQKAAQQQNELGKLPFNGGTCQFFQKISAGLNLPNPMYGQKFGERGFILVPNGSTFGEAYYRIYRSDLPVLITSDSILHVIHCSLDNTVKEIEENLLAPTLGSFLDSCHDRLAQLKVADENPWIESYRDVDLYLTVARNLITTPGTTSVELSVKSKLQQDEKVSEILKLIESQRLQRGPLELPQGDYTKIYGGLRAIDYSHFKPRGHYTQSEVLQGYFRCLMWLSRADCGFMVSGASQSTGLSIDGQRELRDAVILSELMSSEHESRLLDRLDHAIELLSGKSDNLRPATLRKIREQLQLSLADLQQNTANETRLKEAVARCDDADQQIASQVYLGAYPSGEPVPPPRLLQLFGQRFEIDSFVLANVVYDQVQLFDQRGERRWMPKGLDVMAALGNPTAAVQLERELRRWNYAPQLMAAREIATEYFAASEHQSIYDLWLSAIRTLQVDGGTETNFPQVMRTRLWHLKQLQTQLASWSELRHDMGILYAKQSYTRGDGCSYPAGYVEPYPDFYASMANLTHRVSEVVGEMDLSDKSTQELQKFWGNATDVMTKLGVLSRKELGGEAFTEEEQNWLKRTIDNKPSYESRRDYSGWYCKLLYPRPDGIDKNHPTVADVHTDPNSMKVLETGVGSADLIVVAIDNGTDRMAFVGPVYTYYEFTQPGPERLTDEEFAHRIGSLNNSLLQVWERLEISGTDMLH